MSTTNDIEDLLDNAFASHESGLRQEARQLFEQALCHSPHEFDALNMLGVMALEDGDLPAARHWLEQAIASDDQAAMAYQNLALVLIEQGHAQDALVQLERAFQLEPSPATQLARAAAHQRLGEFSQAAAELESVVQLQPDHHAAWFNLGDCLLQTSQWQQAAEAYAASLQKMPPDSPNRVAAWINISMAHVNAGHLEPGLKAADHAIAVDGRHAGAWQARAQALMLSGCASDAQRCLDHALGLDPRRIATQVAKAEACVFQAHHAEALMWCDRALTQDGNHAQARSIRAAALQGLGRLQEALNAYEEAQSVAPHDPILMSNHSGALRDSGRFEHAKELAERATKLAPQLVGAWVNLGNAFQHLGMPIEAGSAFQEALAIKPDDQDVQWAWGWSLLSQGDWERGLALYERRWSRPGRSRKPRNLAMPLWLGDADLRGKRILLHAEQGLGDTLHFCRYATVLHHQGASVTLAVQTPLMSLMQSMDGVHRLIDEANIEHEQADWHCPLLSLPLALKTRSESVPANTPYLSAKPNLIRNVKARLGARTGLRVGLAWSGNALHAQDSARSMPLDLLLTALPSEAGIQYVVLQKDVRDHDRKTLANNPHIFHWEDAVQHFDDTAALATEMDLVVSVDTSVAHLAGALGRPALILLAKMCDWRWLAAGDHTPWYPQARLLRQTSVGDWTPVLSAIHESLKMRQN